MVLGGKLSFKGDAPKKKKKKEKRPRDDAAAASDDDEDLEALVAAAQHDPVAGTGRFTTSGVVVYGTETDFALELAVGDTVMVTISDKFRNESRDEQRIVTMVLGKTSMNLEAPFSCDVTTPTSFMLLKRAPDVAALKAARGEAKKKQRKLEDEESYVTYKVNKPGTSSAYKVWQTVTEKVASGTTREDMLQRRAAEKSDKHCK